MKIPKNIKGRNKIRNAAICLDFQRLIEDKEYPTIEEIKNALSIKYKLTQLRIYQIVRENNAYIPVDKNWEKTKRINRLKLEIKKKESSNKDVADLMEQLRKELEGDKPLINIEKHTHYDLGEVLNKEIPFGNRIKIFASKLSEKNRG